MLFHLVFWAKYYSGRMGPSNEEGQGLVEYAVIILLVAIAIVAVLALFGLQLNDLYHYFVDTLESYTPDG